MQDFTGERVKVKSVWRRISRWGLGTMILLISFILAPSAMAKPEFFAQIPAGYEKSCNLCHSQAPKLNEFGESFKNNGLKFAGLVNPAQAKATDHPMETAPGSINPQKGGSSPAAGLAKPQAKVALILPSEVSRGEKVKLQAKVTVDGSPAKGKQVQFFEQADFFMKGKMELGKAQSNGEGLAEINYWPRSEESQVALTVSVAGDSPAEATAALSLKQTGVSLVEHAEGLHVPFLGLWFVILLLGAVWITYVYIAWSVLRLSKLGEAVPEETTGEKEEEQYASL